MIKTVQTPTLDIAYEEHGPADGDAIVLLHGFPYDPRGYDEVAPPLAAAGYRVIVPYLRGYGPTRFLAADTPRSGEQAALGQDLLDLLDALAIPRAGLVGYDWGGRAACIVAALWPERARCLVTGGGYNIQDIAKSIEPAAPETEYRLWYQYYFHGPRGRDGLAANRYELAKLLWRLWSPTWAFDEATYARSAASFDNPDFVEVVIQSYRHRFGYAPGDPAVGDVEYALTLQPRISVPTISLWGEDDGVSGRPPKPEQYADRFTGRHEHRPLPGIGHNIPQEAPAETVDAIKILMAATA
jgi:pimeloyl-ACP methyl ester carboxylesterase